MLNVRFYGAARTTTGSLHEVEWDGRRILLDCGLFQNHRGDFFEENRRFPFAPGDISAVVLSHAHIPLLNDAGHILGSATVCLDYERDGKPRRLLFTGDVGQGGMPLLRDPVPVPGVNVLITESTYGGRLHPPKENITALLKAHPCFRNCASRPTSPNPGPSDISKGRW